MKSIVEIFNSNNYDQIYSMFNDRLKNEVKSDIVLKFFSDVKGFHGKIKDFEFMKYDKGTRSLFLPRKPITSAHFFALLAL